MAGTNRTVRTSRRRHLPIVAVAIAVAILGACSHDVDVSKLPTELQGTGRTTTIPVTTPIPPCDQIPNGVGQAPPPSSRAGDLLAAYQLNEQYKTSTGFPTDADVWRIAYVTTGIDEQDRQIVCGLVAAPRDGPKLFDGAGRMLAWAHGTAGLEQACMPSMAPDVGLWAQMSDGINAIGWGSGLGARKGAPADGALQTALDRGWVVSATDYQPNDTYVVGRIAAADVIDAGRAASQLMEKVHGGDGIELPDTYDTIAWGHSQGGHAALFAGQLMQPYQEATPNPDAATLRLVGVAALAPASNFMVQPDVQPDIELGNGLADWEMHWSVPLAPIHIPLLELQVGPVLFSYIFASWAELSARGAPDADAALPAFPSSPRPLDLRTVTTGEGATTVAQLQALCTFADAMTVKSLVGKYSNAGAHRMLVPGLWNLPEDYSENAYFRGGVDRTCATTTDDAMSAWCSWIRWNLPGPNADNPYPKLPEQDGRAVPMLIGQGMADSVIHCAPADGADPAAVPAAADCMSVALYDSYRDGGYCASGTAAGHLELALFRKDGTESPAGHVDIPGQISARGSGASAADLTFTGSPLERFMTAAFDRTLTPGCSADVLNP